MDLLPKVETIEGLDLTQPEIAAMKAAYETALSVLNRMAGSADILKYMSIHDELKKKYEDYHEMDIKVNNVETFVDKYFR